MKTALIISLIIKAADFVGIPRELPLAICWVESSYRTHLPHKLDGNTPSYGICQIKLETARYVDKVYKHKYLASPHRLLDPHTNALYASKYIRLLLLQYKGNWQMAIDAYNKGHVVSVKSQYVQKVMLAIEDQSDE